MATEKGISITAVCCQLGYSKQAYYKTKSNNKVRNQKSLVIRQKVLSVRSMMPRLGTRKLHYMLSKEFVDVGIKVGRDRLFDLLREEGLLIKKKRRYTKTTDSKH